MMQIKCYLKDMFNLKLSIIEIDRIEIQRNLSSYMSVYAPAYRFDWRFKKKLWDGKLYFYKISTQTLPRGLLYELKKFCKIFNYSLWIDEGIEINNFSGLSKREVEDFILNLVNNMNIPKEYYPRSYQLKYFTKFIQKNVLLLESPTASGKSLIIYMCLLYTLNLLPKEKQILIIVPTIQLVEQMFHDFKDYGFPSYKYCSRIYSERKKESLEKLRTKKRVIISTWQSLKSLPPSEFQNIGFVVGDEAHEFKAHHAKKIVESCKNVDFKLGTTGTLHTRDKASKMTIEGIFDKAIKYIDINQLIRKKHISDFKIQILNLIYPDNICKMAKTFNFQAEMDFIALQPYKKIVINKICEKIVSKGENVLILFKTRSYGKQLIEEQLKKFKPLYVDGTIKMKDRKKVVFDCENKKGIIAVCSFGTFKRGINIKNLHHIIFSQSIKTEIGLLQSIGRALRIHESKGFATIWDLVDNLAIKKHINFSLRHFNERKEIYETQGFKNIKFKDIICQKLEKSESISKQ